MFSLLDGYSQRITAVPSGYRTLESRLELFFDLFVSTMQKTLFQRPWRLGTRTTLWWAAMAVVMWGAWRQYGGLGLLLAFSMLMFWFTIQFSQTLRVLKRAAGQPKGTVAHALKLHVKLKPGMKLLNVVGMTGSLGEMLSEPDAQPEVFRWSDASGSSVTAHFLDGRLVEHHIQRATADNGHGTDGS